MIRSILGTDLYKLTMGQAIWKLFPQARARYVFTDRNHQTNFTEEFARRLRLATQALGHWRLTPPEAEWLREKCSYLESGYISWLSQFRLSPDDVQIQIQEGQLRIAIEGPWCNTVYWEVPLMATISELYYELIDYSPEPPGGDLATVAAARVKVAKLKAAGVKYADFGTRRRRSYDTHYAVVATLARHGGESFIGTSNVHLARTFDVAPIGTMAHEFVMGVGAMCGLRYANRYAMDAWSSVYHGSLGVALSDTYGTNAFLRDFDGARARLFDGVRQDSGDPLQFIKTFCDHYDRLRIPRGHKTITFSDGLDADKAIELKKCCDSVGIKSAFGIGTNLTNDNPNSPPLNIVIKLHELDDIPLAKLSDTPGKATGHPDAIKEARFVFLGRHL